MHLDNLSPETLILKRRTLRKDLAAQPDLRPIRIAVLGGSTTNALVEILEILLLSTGFRPTFHQSEYGRYYDDAVHDPQPLIDFRPDFVYIHTSCHNIPRIPPAATEPHSADLLESQLARFRAIWDSIETRIGCQIIQNNFELPPYQLLGNTDATAPAGQSRFLMRLNEAFAIEASKRPKLLINDVHSLSAREGLSNWFDWDRFYSYKLLLKPAANVALARSLNALIGAALGKSRKVLILDLDNTLWGGVIGDDGPEKIKIGRETAIAESYTAFQEYCLALRARGVLLAVCSKNNDETARAGFDHPSSILKTEHFSSFKANWQPKHENIEQIAKELNLGLDSFVFVDDNPAERAIVEAQLPSVAVPGVGSEVSAFATIIDSHRYFESAALSKEDFERAELYATNAQRATEQARFADYGEYLDSLAMTAEIETFKPVYLDRIAQLINKTNQYNLTTKRYSLAEVQNLAASPDHICLYGILNDRFGNNGLISIVIGRRESGTLILDLWLMSCRVLKRDMEFAMLDALATKAREAGIHTLQGTYLPTKKNAMVADHYRRLGFEQTFASESETNWTLDLSGYTQKNHHIAYA